MAREKDGYRDELENLREVFGADCHTLKVDEVAEFLRVDRRTVIRQINRRINPLPATNIGSTKKPKYIIAVTRFARWRCS